MKYSRVSVHCQMYESRLGKALKQHGYITQYRESDFNFVQRLLENEGLFYYFEHAADSHTLIITNDSSTLLPLPEQPQIRFCLGMSLPVACMFSRMFAWMSATHSKESA